MLRGILIIVIAALILAMITAGLAIRTQPSPSLGWKEFTIAPATGRSVTINPDHIRGDGLTVRLAIAVAYAISWVRVIGPPWISDQRYAVTAVVSEDSQEPMASLWQKELTKRLNLATHIEKRDFDVYVLTARKGANSGWEMAAGRDAKTYVSDRDMRVVEATTARLAGALEGVLARPVIDETGISGNYNFAMPWGEDRLATVVAGLENRFGLLLTPSRRALDALIVDRAEPDTSLAVIGHVGRLASRLPSGVRLSVSRIAGGR